MDKFHACVSPSSDHQLNGIKMPFLSFFVVPLKCQPWLLWVGLGNTATGQRDSDQFDGACGQHGKDRALDLELWGLGQIPSAVSAQVSSSENDVNTP